MEPNGAGSGQHINKAPQPSLKNILSRLKDSQRPPNLDFRSAESKQKSAEYDQKTEGLFGNSKDLLLKFGLAEAEAQKMSDTLSGGEWMFDRDFLTNQKEVTIDFHEPQPVSKERKVSGKEPFGFSEVPTAEVQFNISTMIRSAVKTANLDPSLADKIMNGFAGLTRYKDFGLSLQFAATEEAGQVSGNAMRFAKLKEQVAKGYTEAESNAIIIGGWTSNIDFARRQPDSVNGPENEADLSQQYLARKKAEGKRAFVVSCAGPGMERNVWTQDVTHDKPFGPHDHALGVAAAYTLLGKTNEGSKQKELTIEGHSMGGAGVAALLQHCDFPEDLNVSVSSLHPAVPGTNAWANITEQITSADDPLAKKVGRGILSNLVSGGIDVLDKGAEKLHAQKYYTPLKEGISRILTGELFLPGDKKNMPQLVKKHVENFKKFTQGSTLSALGSIKDMPLDTDRLKSIMKNTERNTKFVLVTDKDDQMVETVGMLKQLPIDIPLFVLDDGDEGSHYSFKRNCRSMRLGLLQQTMESFNKPQFSYTMQELFLKAYGDKLTGADAISGLIHREADTIAAQFGVPKAEIDAYLAKREVIHKSLVKRVPSDERSAFLASLTASLPQGSESAEAFYQSVMGQRDLGLKYFYSSTPDSLSRIIMPESQSEGMAKIELLMETLEELSDQVHFNVESDSLLKR